MKSDNSLSKLKSKGIKPSIIRLNVLHFLKMNPTHPTVDEIYSNLKDRIPTLSKTSVYNTLDLFVNCGLVAPIYVGEPECRYDYNTDTHGHFMCHHCGKVFDFTIKEVEFADLDSFNIERKDFFFFGRCVSCNYQAQYKKEIS